MKQYLSYAFFLSLLLCGCHYHATTIVSTQQSYDMPTRPPDKSLTGNYIVKFKSMPGDSTDKVKTYVDPVDDTINYKRFRDDLYIDTAGRVFVLSIVNYDMEHRKGDAYIEYYQDMSDLIDAKTYKSFGKGYFATKGKVYCWWQDSEHEIPMEIAGADTGSFTSFMHVAGGKDKQHVFIGAPPSDFELVRGADANSLRILSPPGTTWNNIEYYLADKKNVFWGTKRIASADAKTFHLSVNSNFDAEDKSHRYLKGKVVSI